MKHLQNFNTIQEMLNYEKLCRPCVVSYPTGNPAPNDRAAIYNPIDNPSEIGNPTRVIESAGAYIFDNTLDLNITSNTTIQLRCKYRNITVSNNAVLTISDTFVQALDTITVEAGSQIRVSPTSVLVAGSNGIVTADVNGLYLESYQTNQATFLFNGTTQNNHPLATVDLYLYCKKITDGYVFHHFGRPILPNGTIECSVNIAYSIWNTKNGWEYKSIDIVQSGDNFLGYNCTVADTNVGNILKFKGQLIGNNNISIPLDMYGYYNIGNAYTADIPTINILNMQKSIHTSEQSIQFYSAATYPTQGKVITIVDDSNISDYPIMPSKQNWFGLHDSNIIDTFTINYNDVILAYYKQKYNF